MTRNAILKSRTVMLSRLNGSQSIMSFRAFCWRTECSWKMMMIFWGENGMNVVTTFKCWFCESHVAFKEMKIFEGKVIKNLKRASYLFVKVSGNFEDIHSLSPDIVSVYDVKRYLKVTS
ncbi:hypothetical protein TNIN_75931 [Trichonephila inaurata madagascariensis]|uniref:Uncharacterized protein n=1 Tax=Trichonephila inaurata madagascariensis TaxID=2747483 RepID=A0A8X7CB83_9ARAC|nr:hypothetical protein TNIN_75931 [Trichonephila inaurata madagascariensis]